LAFSKVDSRYYICKEEAGRGLPTRSEVEESVEYAEGREAKTLISDTHSTLFSIS
jgi:hypothetical protein